jgi:lipoprotein
MSELALIKEQTLTNIGDAIREKTETTELIFPKDMPAKIRTISGLTIDDFIAANYILNINETSFTNQYLIYKTFGPIEGIYNSADNPTSNLNNGIGKIRIEVKPNEGYDIGSMDVTATVTSEDITVYENFITSNIEVTQHSAAVKATQIDFSNYMERWYGDNRSTLTDVTATTNNIITDATITAKENPDSNTTTLNSMFAGCNSLQNIPKITVNTTNVTEAVNMFEDCTSLQKVDLSGINTSNITNISGILKNCTALTSVDLNVFKRTKVKNISDFCSGCTNLEILDMRNIDFGKTGFTYTGFVSGCNSLRYLILDGPSLQQFMINSDPTFIAELAKRNHNKSYKTTIIFEGNLQFWQLVLQNYNSNKSLYDAINISVDWMVNYNITKPGDGTIQIQPKSQWHELTVENEIFYRFPNISNLNAKKVRLRITGTSKYQSNNYTFTNLEIPVVFKVDPNMDIIFAVTTGKMPIFKNYLNSNPQIQSFIPGLYAQINSNSYDNDCMFMITDSSASPNYSIHIIMENNATQCGRCRNGSEVLMPNIRYLHYFSEFNITKLEYKVIEDADILPTDYKLNFD